MHRNGAPHEGASPRKLARPYRLRGYADRCRPIDRHDSMVKEKAVADPNRDDPRWMNVFPSSEMPAWRRQWPVVPSFQYGGINYGDIG